MTNNTFKIGLSTFTIDHLHEAERLSDALFQDSLNQRYSELSSDELHCFLMRAFELTDEHGLVNLLPNVQMPGDIRDLMMHRPSYCVIAAGIYACTHFQMADEPLMDHLKSLMDAAFQYGIVAHGFGGDKVKRDVLRILFQAGTEGFLETYPGINENFSNCIDYNLYILEHTATPDNPEGKWFRDDFADAPCNAQMHQLLAIWDKQPNAVFVYGTLMKGQRANRLIASGSYAGRFVLDGYNQCIRGKCFRELSAGISGQEQLQNQCRLYLLRGQYHQHQIGQTAFSHQAGRRKHRR